MAKTLILSLDPYCGLIRDYDPSANNWKDKVYRDNTELFTYIERLVTSSKYEEVYLCCGSSNNLAANYEALSYFHEILCERLVGKIGREKLHLDLSSYADYHYQRTPESTFRGVLERARDTFSPATWNEAYPRDPSTISWHLLLLQKYANKCLLSDEHNQPPILFQIISSNYAGETNPKKVKKSLDAVNVYFNHYTNFVPTNIHLQVTPYKNGKLSIKDINRIPGAGPSHVSRSYDVSVKNMLAHAKSKNSGEDYNCLVLTRKIPHKNYIARYWDYFLLGLLIPPALTVMAFLAIACTNLSLLHWILALVNGNLAAATTLMGGGSILVGLAVSALCTYLFPRKAQQGQTLPQASFIQRQWKYLTAGVFALPILSIISFVIFGYANPAAFSKVVAWASQTLAEIGGTKFAVVAGLVLSSALSTLITAIIAKFHNPVNSSFLLTRMSDEHIRSTSTRILDAQATASKRTTPAPSSTNTDTRQKAHDEQGQAARPRRTLQRTTSTPQLPTQPQANKPVGAPLIPENLKALGAPTTPRILARIRSLPASCLEILGPYEGSLTDSLTTNTTIDTTHNTETHSAPLPPRESLRLFASSERSNPLTRVSDPGKVNWQQLSHSRGSQ